ncbi:nucleotidyltransferase family protein [Euzebyella saccharophila]|uniref:NTP transferase domain-containing protein n=1 Tax=Euzebyella saccharophila TaxID=679664 RepID=A0ABV8JQQ7_9FLAO|nr:nucleotidyltransferase family protein [Euzebyella saccharophila]
MDNPKKKIALLILAAGNSSRMGTIKQLLPWKKTTLLGIAIENAVASNSENIYVVLGAYEPEIRIHIPENGFRYVVNPDWESGMGGSIATGVEHILNEQKGTTGILIMLADQPMVDTLLLNQLMEKFFNSSKNIIACEYDKNVGVPALFGREFFEQLSNLGTKTGAQTIISLNPQEVCSIKLHQKAMDIDTQEEYLQLLKRMN